MASPISYSKTVFRFLLVITTFLTLVTFLLFLLQEPGTGSYVVSVLTLLMGSSFIAFLLIALHFEWEPFEPFEKYE